MADTTWIKGKDSMQKRSVLSGAEVDAMCNGDLAKYIDHTILKANATQQDIENLCKEALDHGFFSVCVNSCWVPLATKLLKNSHVKVCTVVGFPLGAMSTRGKACETKQAVTDGAVEIDMVINVGMLKAGAYDAVLQDISEVRKAVGDYGILKVIIETCLLTDEEKMKACELSVAAGADFVKTSTGFSTGGASVEDISLMRSVVGPSIGVKASGGIRSAESARAMLKAGATRIGTGSGVAVIAG